jgi:hypothetical protein
MARHFGIPPRNPQSRAWRDAERDWLGWSRAERVSAPLILCGLIAATVPMLWLIAQ